MYADIAKQVIQEEALRRMLDLLTGIIEMEGGQLIAPSPQRNHIYLPLQKILQTTIPEPFVRITDLEQCTQLRE